MLRESGRGCQRGWFGSVGGKNNCPSRFARVELLALCG